MREETESALQIEEKRVNAEDGVKVMVGLARRGLGLRTSAQSVEDAAAGTPDWYRDYTSRFKSGAAGV